MEIGDAKQRVLLAAVGAALLISGCLYSLARLGAEKANLTTAKLTYANLGAPRWTRDGTIQGTPGKGQIRARYTRAFPQPPQFVRTPVRTYPSSGETLAAEMRAHGPWYRLDLVILCARSHLV